MELAVHNVAWIEAYLRTKWHLDSSIRFTTTDMGRKLVVVGLCSFLRGELTQSNTMWPQPRPTSIPSGILIIQPFGYNNPPPPPAFRGGWGLGPHLTQCGQGWGLTPYQVESWSTQPFGHNTWAEKWGRGCVPFWRGELGSHLRQCRLGWGLPPCQV